MKFHLGTAFSVLFVFSSAQAGTVDLGRNLAIDVSGLSPSYPDASKVLQDLPNGEGPTMGAAPADFARTMEVLRRAYFTLPKTGPSQLDWQSIQKNPPVVARLSERDKILYALYLRTPRTPAAADAMGMKSYMRVNFAFSYARYLFDDAWSVGGGFNPDRSQKTTQKEQDFAFFKMPYSYVAWGLYLADRALSQKQELKKKTVDEQKTEATDNICYDVNKARLALLEARRLNRSQPLPGFEAVGNKAFVAFTKAMQRALPEDIRKITGAFTYTELCQLPARDLVSATAMSNETVVH